MSPYKEVEQNYYQHECIVDGNLKRERNWAFDVLIVAIQSKNVRRYDDATKHRDEPMY